MYEGIYGETIKYNTVLYSQRHESIIQRFNCGNDEMNNFLKSKATKDLLEGESVTKLILNWNEDRVIGYYSLNCCSSVIFINNKMYLSPAVEIKMFAIDLEYQDIPWSIDKENGTFSDNLLCEPIKEIYDFSSNICGAKHILLYAVPESINFYKRNGFNFFNEYMRRKDDRYVEGCEGMFVSL